MLDVARLRKLALGLTAEPDNGRRELGGRLLDGLATGDLNKALGLIRLPIIYETVVQG